MAGVIRVYKTYSFVDKDPIIDKVRTAIQDFARAKGMKESQAYVVIDNKGAVTSGTLRNWFFGDTKRPQHAGLNATLRAIDKELAIVDRRHRRKRA